MLDVLLLLSVARGFLEGFDDEGRSGWDNRYCCLSVLDSESDCNTKTFLKPR